MAGRRIKNDAVGVRRRLDRRAGFERCEVERDRDAGFAVVGVAGARRGRDCDAVRHARYDDRAGKRGGLAVDDADAITVRDVDAIGHRIENDVIPALRSAQRYRTGRLVERRRIGGAGGLCRERQDEAGGDGNGAQRNSP
jgi:hypothetical protein